MASESQLRDLLLELEAGAPTVREILDGLALDPIHRAESAAAWRRRRTWAVGGAVAACALVVGVGVLSANVADQHPWTGSPGVAPALRTALLPGWHFTVADLPGYTVRRDSIIRMDPVTSVAQRASITSTTSRVTGSLDVSVPAPRQSAHDTGNWRAIADGGLGPRTKLTIDGRVAYYFHPVALTPRELRSTHGDAWAAAAEYYDNQPRLAWQLADHAIVEVSGTFGFEPAPATWDEKSALRVVKTIARATSYSKATPVTVPFRLGADPDGFIPLGVSLVTGSQCIGYGTGTDRRREDPTWNWYDVCRYTGKLPLDEATAAERVATRRLSDGTTLGLFTGGWPGQRTPITKAEGRSILHDADVSPLVADRSTWLPIR